MSRVVSGFVAAALFGLLAASPVAAAKIDGTTIEGAQLKTKNFSVASIGNTGGTVQCPKSKRVLNGGAFWHATGMDPDPSVSNHLLLTSSAPTANGRGWYADGQANGGGTLTVEVRCLPKKQLNDVVRRTKSKVLKTGIATALVAKCPNGYATMTGGSTLANVGKKPKPSVGPERGRITGSLPDGPNLDEWRTIGGNFSNGKLELSAIARCIPENRIDGHNASFPTVSVVSNATGGGYGSCAGGTRALTGGSSWRAVGQQKPTADLASTTYLSGNATTFDVLGHYTAGYNLSGSTLNLDTAIICPNA
jgi:hypothetical protein